MASVQTIPVRNYPKLFASVRIASPPIFRGTEQYNEQPVNTRELR